MTDNYMKKLKELLIFEKDNLIKNGVYGYSQRSLAYNSNHIEGSTLTQRQTQYLFDTGTYLANEGSEKVVAKDIEEAQGHFKMFNYMLETYDDQLSHKLIKEYHFYLKSGVFFDYLNGYAVGEYKKRSNFVGEIVTAKPDEVESKMNELLNWYYDLKHISLKELAIFHAAYEKIHPFQDGNGRTGRLIIFKECLKNNIAPLIISDDNKAIYYDALRIAQLEENYDDLIKLFFLEQEQYYLHTFDLVI